MKNNENKEMTKYQELFSSIGQFTGTDASGFIQILDTPDDEFEKTYELFKPQVLKFFASETYQHDIIQKMSIMPDISLKEERDAAAALLNTIDNDESLSPFKKDFIHLIMDSTIDVISDLLESRRTRIDVKVVRLNDNAIIPEYAHPTDAGADISSCEETIIKPGETKLVRTGLAVAIPDGYEIQIRPRSGLSIKTPLRIPNSPATIDSEYRGEIKVPIWNTGDTIHVIDKGMRIAQMLIAPTPMIRWNEVETIEELGSTERGSGGFGSTGLTANEKT